MNSEEKSTNQNTNSNSKPDQQRMYFNRYRKVAYLPPRYATLFDAYVKFNDGESESSCMVEIVKNFFNSMPEQQRQRIINYSKNGY